MLFISHIICYFWSLYILCNTFCTIQAVYSSYEYELLLNTASIITVVHIHHVYVTSSLLHHYDIIYHHTVIHLWHPPNISSKINYRNIPITQPLHLPIESCPSSVRTSLPKLTTETYQLSSHFKWLQKCIHLYVFVCVCVCVPACVRVQACVCVYIYSIKFVYMVTHIHIMG